MDWIVTHWAVIATLLFLISELIGEIPWVKSSSVFGLLRSFLKGEAKKAKPQIEKLADEKQT